MHADPIRWVAHVHKKISQQNAAPSSARSFIEVQIAAGQPPALPKYARGNGTEDQALWLTKNKKEICEALTAAVL